MCVDSVMNYSKLVVYTLSRIGLMILISAFSAFCGVVVFPSLITLLPSSLMEFKNFMASTETQSFIGFLIVAAFMLMIFYNDGKKHTAYETWSIVNISIVYICMFLAYFVFSVFRDSLAAEGKGMIFYKIFYFPCFWIYNENSMNFMASVMIESAAVLILCFIVYVFSYKLYIKKHPDIYKSVH